MGEGVEANEEITMRHYLLFGSSSLSEKLFFNKIKYNCLFVSIFYLFFSREKD